MQEQKYSIKQWAKDERPREKLLGNGAESLTNSELLAILIQNGTKEKTAVDLGREILRLGKDSLNELGKMSSKELMRSAPVTASWIYGMNFQRLWIGFEYFKRNSDSLVIWKDF